MRTGTSLVFPLLFVAKHTEKKTGKKMFFVSACEKYKEHQGTAQQGRLKHLLVTGPSMRLLQGTAIFGRKKKSERMYKV